MMNIIFVCHGGLKSQSSYHVLNMAEQLVSLGHHCIACVPQLEVASVEGICTFQIPIFTYEQLREEGYSFPNGASPDLVHCWTPRETPRKFTEYLVTRYSCPYIVHLEDNEREVLHRYLGGRSYEELVLLTEEEQEELIPNSHTMINPFRHWEFLKRAAGCTVLMDKLKEQVPQGIPVRLFWPGYDSCFEQSRELSRNELRLKYDIPLDGFVVLYSGNFSWAMENEFCQMVCVLALLRKRGMPLYFIKTGLNGLPDLIRDGVEEGWIKDLGFIPRDEMPDVYAVSDILVQPGAGDAFNDYRFPSKLPEAMISGLPIILPCSNIGRSLKDGEEALITHTGSMDELREKIVTLYADSDLRNKISVNARCFAKEKLNWATAGKNVGDFYCKCLSPEACRDECQTEQTTHLYRYSGETSSSLHSRLCEPIHLEECFGLFRPLVKSEVGRELSNMGIIASSHSGTGTILPRVEWLEKKFRKKRKRDKRLVIGFIAVCCLLAGLIAFALIKLWE